MNGSGLEGEKGIIAPASNIFSGVDRRASLANKNRTRVYELAIMTLETQAFPDSISAVRAAALSFFMCHRCPPVSAPALTANGFDTDFGEVLPMTAEPTIILLPLVMEDPDFRLFPVPKNRSLNGRRVEDRITDLDIALVSEEKDLAKAYQGTRFSLHLFNPDHVAGCHPILLSACFDHRIHFIRVPPSAGTKGGLGALEALPKRYFDSF